MALMMKVSTILGFIQFFFFYETWCFSLCKTERNNYFSFVNKNPGIVDSPRGYLPSCNENGKFMAMQRNENFFFCVSIDSGTIIPNTEAEPHSLRFISENVCHQCSNLWNSFLDWYHDEENEDVKYEQRNVTEKSCQDGFEYRSCDCPRTCIPGRNMTDVEAICAFCKPICTCPSGFYEYNGECVSIGQCLTLKPDVNSLETIRLMWTAYFEAYATDSLKRTITRSIPIEEENIDENWIEE